MRARAEVSKWKTMRAIKTIPPGDKVHLLYEELFHCVCFSSGDLTNTVEKFHGHSSWFWHRKSALHNPGLVSAPKPS